MSKPAVLFACIHNAGRSVVAQALARHYGGDAIVVRSAGSEPGVAVNPTVAQVLAERGLPVTRHMPRKLDRDLVQDSDVVITMGWGRPARSSQASATRTGRWPTLPARTLTRFAASSTTSTDGFGC